MQAELTAGINHTSVREGYLPIFDVLARWSCDVIMGGQPFRLGLAVVSFKGYVIAIMGSYHCSATTIEH